LGVDCGEGFEGDVGARDGVCFFVGEVGAFGEDCWWRGLVGELGRGREKGVYRL